MGPLNLDDIPGGSLYVIDTNVRLYAEQGASIRRKYGRWPNPRLDTG